MSAPKWLRELAPDGALLSANALLLELDGNHPRLLDRFPERLLAWSRGQRGWREAFAAYLAERDLVRAARCCMQAKGPGERAQLVERLGDAWNQWRKDRAEELASLRKEAEALRSAGITWPSAGDLEDFLKEGEQYLAKLPAANLGLEQPLAVLDPAEPGKLQEILLFARTALDEGRKALAELEEERQRRLHEIKQRVDQLINELLPKAQRDDRLKKDIPKLQAASTEALFAGEIGRAEELLRQLEDMRKGRYEPTRASTLLQGVVTPVASPIHASSEPMAPPRGPLLPEELSHIVQLRFNEPLSAAADVPVGETELASVFYAWTWEDDLLEAWSRKARQRARQPDDTPMESALGVFLLCEAKRYLLKDEPLFARAFFFDGFRWACQSTEEVARVARDTAFAGLLLSNVLLFLPSRERHRHLPPRDLSTQLQRRSGSLIFWNERLGLLGELARILVASGPRTGCLLLEEYLLPYLEARPRAAQDLASALGGQSDYPAALAILCRLLERLLPDPPAAVIEALGKLRGSAQDLGEAGVSTRDVLHRLRGLLIPMAEDADLGRAVDEALQRVLERPQEPRPATLPIRQRLATSNIVLHTHPRLVVELGVPGDSAETAPELRSLRAEVLGFDERERHLPKLLAPAGLIIRLATDEPRELILESSVQNASDLARLRYLEVRYQRLDIDGRKIAIEATPKRLSLSPARPSLDAKPPSNPYVVGRAIQNVHAIFGRETEIERIWAGLTGAHQDNVVLVLGERRIGKTTLLNAIEQDERFRERYLIVKDELQLRSETNANVLFRTKLLHKIRTGLKEHGITPPPVQDARFNESPDEAFKEFMRNVDQFLGAKGRRLLIILDELDQLVENRAFGELAVAAFRAVILESRYVSFILAGATEILRRHTLTREDRLFKLAIEVKLRPIDDVSARSLVRKPAERSYEVTARATDLILRETGRHPYLIQSICHRLFERMTRWGERCATATDVEEILAQDLVPRREIFHDLRMAVSEEEEDRLVKALAALQSGNRYVSLAEIKRELVRTKQPVPENLSERMARLADEAPLVVERRLTTYQYRLTIGLFARHLRYLQDERSEP